MMHWAGSGWTGTVRPPSSGRDSRLPRSRTLGRERRRRRATRGRRDDREPRFGAVDPAQPSRAAQRLRRRDGRRTVAAGRGAAMRSAGVDRSFCAGGSLASLSTPTPGQLRHLYRASLRLFDAIRTCPRPVIAAVNGPAAGGGNELVVACDLAVAARSATFGQTGPRVGSSPVTGATNVMSVQIGEKRAKELSMLCRRYSADDALRMGLVNAVVDDDALEATVEAWCDELAALSPATSRSPRSAPTCGGTRPATRSRPASACSSRPSAARTWSKARPPSRRSAGRGFPTPSRHPRFARTTARDACARARWHE